MLINWDREYHRRRCCVQGRQNRWANKLVGKDNICLLSPDTSNSLHSLSIIATERAQLPQGSHARASVFGLLRSITGLIGVDLVGDGLVVDEFIMRMTHDRDVPFLLPGLAPTGKTVEIPAVVIVKFRGDLMESERLYWDQAALLRQLGLIDASLPVADVAEVSGYLRALS